MRESDALLPFFKFQECLSFTLTHSWNSRETAASLDKDAENVSA